MDLLSLQIAEAMAADRQRELLRDAHERRVRRPRPRRRMRTRR